MKDKPRQVRQQQPQGRQWRRDNTYLHLTESTQSKSTALKL
jgi:hypothetical protein